MDPLAEDTKRKITKVLDVIKGDLGTIRTGRAAPALVESIVIPVYGGTTRLKVLEVATVGVSDSKTLVLSPFDPSIINEIAKGIQDGNVGLTPVVDGHLIRISIPPLSQERREELIKSMRHKLENGRIMVRQVRHDAMLTIKKDFEGREDDIMRLEKEVQKVVDDTMKQIDDLGEQKEKELMQI